MASATNLRRGPSANSRTNGKKSVRSLDEVRTQQPLSIPVISGWIVAAVFLLLTLVFHSSILFGNHFLWEDFVEQEFPFRTLATTSLAHGIIPHWDPYVFGGMPFTADIQVAFWYPFNMLQSLFVSGGYLSPVVMEWFILLHYAVAGFGMYWFAKRVLDVDDWSALFGGIAYAFSGYIVAQSIHQMIVYHIALFPFVACLFVLGFDAWKPMIGAGLVLGVMYLSGHPQSTLYFTFTLGILALYELGYRLRTKREPLKATTVIRMALPVLIGLGIFAIQLLPSQELAALSRRDVITYDKSVDGSLSWGHLYTFVMPRLFGLTNGANDAKVPYWNGPYYNSWETAIYIGVLPLFFALLGGLSAWKKKYVPFLVGMSAFALLFALGNHFFLYRIFFSLPLFDKLRTPARMMMVFSFTACALSAVGLAEAMRSTSPKWGGNGGLVVRALLVLPWILAIAGLIHANTFLTGVAPEADASISWAAGLAAFPVLAMLVLTLLHYRNTIRGLTLGLLAISITVIELFSYGMSLNASPDDPRLSYREQPDIVSMLQEDAKKEISRARTRLGNQMILKRNQGAYDKLQLIEGYNPLVLQRVAPEMANTEGSLDLMNIKWSILPQQGGASFGQRPTYLPRVKLYYADDVRSDSDARALLHQDPTYDYRNRILLEDQPDVPLGPPDQTAAASISAYSENTITVQVHSNSEAMLFFSEVWYPAWKAYIDGRPTKLYRAFTTLRAVEVPAGSHTVTLRYESSAFATGSTITILTLLFSCGALGFFALRDASKRKSASTSSEVLANKSHLET